MKIYRCVFFVVSLLSTLAFAKEKMPADFVYLKSVDPTIVEEMRLAGDHNFVGHPVVGYLAPKCILTKKAASALASVQKELKKQNLTLKVYDCYRPQMAVESLVQWAADFNDKKMKDEFYPNVDKTDIFNKGYLASKSSHSRGSAIDVTLVPLPASAQSTYNPNEKLKGCNLGVTNRFKDNSIDMGTGYGCFDPLAIENSPDIKLLQRQNRNLLKTAMEKAGFESFLAEWWHYTLKDEPYHDKYFNFEVR